jgi:hypothetical protein
MLQVFRLVWPGRVDKVLAFDSLPPYFLRGIQKREAAGFPRNWKRWLFENGCTMVISKTEIELDEGGKPVRDKQGKPIVKSVIKKDIPAFYVLDYLTLNTDKEKWSQISQFARRVVDLKTRLTDKLEDMGKGFASDSYSQLELEPEDVPIIHIPKDAHMEEDDDFSKEKKDEDEVSSNVEEETKPEAIIKKRGRHKKVLTEA